MVATFTWPKYENSYGMQRGIENVVSFEDIDLGIFYDKKDTISAYGEKRSIETLDKTRLCEHICGLDNEELKERFSRFRPTLEKIAKFFSG